MKKIVLIFLIFISIINISYGGCFYKNKEDYKVESNNPCISTAIVTTCQANVLLLLKSECGNKYYVFNEKNEKLELNSNLNYPYEKSYILENRKYDYIPEKKGKWSRKIVNIDDDKDIIYINGSSFLYYNLLNINLRKEIIYLLFILIIFFVLHKKGILKNIQQKLKK